MQYFIFVLYLWQNLLVYGILMLGSNFVVSSINYLLIRTSFKKIKEIAEKTHTITVLRGGVAAIVDSSALVPGDIYYPQECIPCDSIVVQRNLFVSEVGFTGETIPIGKFSLTDP